MARPYRRALFALAAFLCAAVPRPALAAPDTLPTTRPAVRTLGRSMAKVKADRALTVGYFGGSITAGAGASKPQQTSWRALTTAWFRQQFPDAKVTEIDAAVGGTGSDLGAFRCQDDLLAKHPDLVFVEFAVNDGGAPEIRTKRAMDGIVRQIWTANPATDIVFVYTTTNTLAPAYDAGGVPKAVAYDAAVAAHYGIPEVNVGRALWQAIRDGKGTWETLTTDGVHPNDAGYAIYFGVLREFLAAHLNDPPAPPVTLPAPLVPGPFDRGRLADAWSADAPGWDRVDKPLAGRFPHHLAAEKAGATLTFKFTGTAVGLYWLIAPDAGDVEWSVDGGPPARRSGWDHYALKFSRANYALLRDDLPPGDHVLTVTALGEKNEQSTGTWVRIGAFLVQ